MGTGRNCITDRILKSVVFLWIYLPLTLEYSLFPQPLGVTHIFPKLDMLLSTPNMLHISDEKVIAIWLLHNGLRRNIHNGKLKVGDRISETGAQKLIHMV